MISGSSGGFLLSYPVNLTPGETIPITVGAGGLASAHPNGGPGGDTIFGSYLACTGALKAQPTCEAWSCAGTCGAAGGAGIIGQYVSSEGGIVAGGNTPLVYGSGGADFRCNGCAAPNPTIGWNGASGVVIVDVLY